MNENTAKKLCKAILDMFERWEPRVEITGVQINPDPDQNLFQIEVVYTVPSLGNNVLKFNTAVNQRRT